MSIVCVPNEESNKFYDVVLVMKKSVQYLTMKHDIDFRLLIITNKIDCIGLFMSVLKQMC